MSSLFFFILLADLSVAVVNSIVMNESKILKLWNGIEDLLEKQTEFIERSTGNINGTF